MSCLAVTFITQEINSQRLDPQCIFLDRSSLTLLMKDKEQWTSAGTKGLSYDLLHEPRTEKTIIFYLLAHEWIREWICELIWKEFAMATRKNRAGNGHWNPSSGSLPNTFTQPSSIKKWRLRQGSCNLGFIFFFFISYLMVKGMMVKEINSLSCLSCSYSHIISHPLDRETERHSMMKKSNGLMLDVLAGRQSHEGRDRNVLIFYSSFIQWILY